MPKGPSGTDLGVGAARSGPNPRLEAANGRLTKLVAEREVLLVEVNHRAKNSLAIASASSASKGCGSQTEP